MYKQKIDSLGLKFVGCEPIETNDNGDPLHKSKLPKGYTREYIRVLKQFEKDMLEYKIKMMKQ